MREIYYKLISLLGMPRGTTGSAHWRDDKEGNLYLYVPVLNGPGEMWMYNLTTRSTWTFLGSTGITPNYTAYVHILKNFIPSKRKAEKEKWSRNPTLFFPFPGP